MCFFVAQKNTFQKSGSNFFYWSYGHESWCVRKLIVWRKPAKIKALSNCKIFDEFHSKLCYFSCSLEKNTPKFRITIFHFRINPCVEMLKWRATRHSKAEKLNFVLRKCKCSLGNSSGLILKSGYHAENPWKTRHFYVEALFGYHKVSWWYPKVSQEKVWYFSLKMTCHTWFLNC